MIELSGYSIKEEISRRHGFLLYRGKRDKDGRPVLIMVFGSSNVTNTEIARFKHKFSMIKNLESDGLISLYGMEEFSGGFAVIARDFVGIPLRECYPGGRCDIMDFMNIALQLARTIGEIHQAHIIHRGIMPGNIFINPETGRVKIIEPGLSFIFSRENEHLYQPEVLSDTLPYISPEQTGRMNRIVDFRTDFYSLGIVFYELLTGTVPFFSDNPLELLHSHIARIPQVPIRHRIDIPEMISEIIMKLLSKNPEDRYHCGGGLMFDLEKCRSQVETMGWIVPFEMGQMDIDEELDIPQKIYGRENEIDELIASFDRVNRGRSELMLVTGDAGIGKSALVNEMSKTVITRGGYFLWGKFEPLRMNVPYSALIQALEGLIDQLLAESEERIAQWKERITEALGNKGKIITNIIPGLELLIGKQPEIPELRMDEAQRRFNLEFQDLVRVFSDSGIPMVIFLDDLQWAGSPGLDLILSMMSDSSIQRILFIVAYRDSEVGLSHRLKLWLDRIEEAGLPCNQLFVRPLHIQSVHLLVADTLRSSAVVINSLSELIYEKTGGNPFFVKQFLTMLYDEKMLTFSPGRGWEWNLDGIKKMEAADNVVDLTIKKIRSLPEGPLDILKASSCFGGEFHLEEIAELYAKSMNETYADLFVCMEYGLVLNMKDTYMFSHDRIHETAYSLLSDNEKKELHYRIGKTLLKDSEKGEEISDNLFNIVNHLNLGMDLITDKKERTDLARLNLTASQKAKSSAAYEAANQYLQMGIELLPKDAWEREYELTLSLFTEMGEVRYLMGDNKQADIFLNVVLRNAKSLLDKVKVYETKITSFTVRNRREEAFRIGMEALFMLGVDIPEEANPQVITNEMNLVKKNIGDREVEALINLPELNDPHKLAVARIFTSCMTVVYTSAPEYFPLIVLKLVNLSLKHGNSIYSPFAYAAFGVILCGRLGEIETGYGFGEMALKLIDKFHTEVLKAKIYYVFGDMINHWKNHYREDLPYLLESYRSGSEAGDLSFASYAMNHYVMTSFLMGEPLGEVREKLERNYEVIQKYQQWSVIQEYKLLFQMVLNLNGEAEDKLRIKGDMTDEGKIVPEWERANMITAIGYYTVEKQFLLYLYRDYKGSIDTAVVGERCLETMTGMNLFAEYHFYYSLALLAHYPDTSIDEQKDYLKKVKTYQEKMEKWASHAPANFEHKFLLLEAEISRLNGEIKSTISLFDRAIESARRNSFIQDEAIANERAALFYLSEGMKKIARLYMQEAHKGYKRWGAVMKVSDLEEEYPYLSAEPGVDRTFIPDDRQSKRPPQPDASMILDYKSTVKSLQAISSEIILEDLMNKLMKIVVEISGATRGLVILFKEGKLSVEAERIVLDKEVSIVHSFPLDKRDDLLIPLINYVRRTKEYVVLSDAQKEGNFTLDPYVLKNQSKSICCLPIIRQSRPVGILYLENTIATGAFTPDRMEILRLFATQAAISIENALLVDSMAKAERALRHSEEEYRNLIERANDGIVIVQHEVFKYVNQKMAKMVGYTVDELINEHISKFIHPDDYPRVLDQNKRRMAGEKSPEIYEIRLIHRDGYSLSIEVNAGTSTYNHRTAGLIFCRDITERKRVEEELTKHREHLEELVGERTAQLKATQQELVAKERLATLGKVTATVSHEIRNPLGTIRTSLYSINERVRGKGLCIEETLARAERSIVRCDRIIEELLDFTRSRDLYPEPTVIDEWLDQTLDEHVIPEGITLTWKPGAGVEISLDREHFRRCLVNIMDNAIKAIEEKRENMISRGRELGVDHLIVESRVVEDRFELRITDTGTGIPSDHLEKIFEPLFSTRGFGVGLGLVIVKRIMEQHGGGIKIDSKTDKGTTVTLWLLTGE